MMILRWFRQLFGQHVSKQNQAAARRGRRRGKTVFPCIEVLENRTLPSAYLVQDINADVRGATFGPLTASGGKAFFTGDNGTGGTQLYASDRNSITQLASGLVSFTNPL